MATRSIGRRLLVALGVAAAALVLLLVVAIALVNSGAATKRVVDLVLPTASKALGRDVTVKGATLKIFPNPRVELAGLSVSGRPGEPALVDAESLDVEVGLWPLLVSFGKDVEVRAIILVRPTVNLVKGKDRRWNFEGLGETPQGATPSPPPSPEPAPSAGGTRVAIALVGIHGGAVHVLDRSQGSHDAGLALTQLDFEARGVGPGLPLEATLAAALAAEKQNLHAQLSIAKLPDAVPQRPADWPTVQGSVRLDALGLDRIRALFPGDLGAIVRGGAASLDAKLITLNGRYRVDGAGSLENVRLRGQPSSGRFRAGASWSPASPGAFRVDVTDLAIRGPGVDLGGNLSVETPPLRAWFVVTGPLLDVDAVMGVLPEPAATPKPAQPPSAEGGAVVPEATRREIEAAAAHGTIAIERLKAGRIEATDVKARATLTKGTLLLDDLTLSTLGGRVSGAGTRVSLAESVPKWKLNAKLSGLDLQKAIAAFEGSSPLLGKVDGTVDVDGEGTDWGKMRDGLTGVVEIAVKDGALTTTNLADSVLGGVAKGLGAAGQGGAASRIGGEQGAKTTFRDLDGHFTVKDGFLITQKPFTFGSPAGDTALGGKIGLDGRLGLEGTVQVPKSLLGGVAPGLKLPDKLPVPVAISGTIHAPSVSVRADEAVNSLVKSQTNEAVNAARKRAEEQGRKGLQDLLKRFAK